MKSWREVINPHPDIRAGKFEESVFAADLSDVIADRGPLEYCDAELFFRRPIRRRAW
jgi:predicted AAA+ superfamily ATPase